MAPVTQDIDKVLVELESLRREVKRLRETVHETDWLNGRTAS